MNWWPIKAAKTIQDKVEVTIVNNQEHQVKAYQDQLEAMDQRVKALEERLISVESRDIEKLQENVDACEYCIENIEDQVQDLREKVETLSEESKGVKEVVKQIDENQEALSDGVWEAFSEAIKADREDYKEKLQLFEEMISYQGKMLGNLQENLVETEDNTNHRFTKVCRCIDYLRDAIAQEESQIDAQESLQVESKLKTLTDAMTHLIKEVHDYKTRTERDMAILAGFVDSHQKTLVDIANKVWWSHEDDMDYDIRDDRKNGPLIDLNF